MPHRIRRWRRKDMRSMRSTKMIILLSFIISALQSFQYTNKKYSVWKNLEITLKSYSPFYTITLMYYTLTMITVHLYNIIQLTGDRLNQTIGESTITLLDYYSLISLSVIIIIWIILINNHIKTRKWLHKLKWDY